MSRKTGPGINWIGEQFTKAVKDLVSREGDIRSRMRFAVPWIYSFDPDAISDDQVRKKIISFRKSLEGKYPTCKQAIESRRFETLSKLALQIWSLSAEIHDLAKPT